jgi:L,D-peptidoglycan transpeptidase YkuD (ErfK/YbiS/YcfS/YnhG family)
MKIHKAIFGMFFLAVNGCAAALPPPELLRSLKEDVRQALVVEADAKQPTKARLSAWQRDKGNWEVVFPSMRSVLGRNGLAPAGEKKEGDGRTPSGTFALRRSFGYPKAVETKLDYAQATPDDFWIDDPASAEYNTWVKGFRKQILLNV